MKRFVCEVLSATFLVAACDSLGTDSRRQLYDAAPWEFVSDAEVFDVDNAMNISRGTALTLRVDGDRLIYIDDINVKYSIPNAGCVIYDRRFEPLIDVKNLSFAVFSAYSGLEIDKKCTEAFTIYVPYLALDLSPSIFDRSSDVLEVYCCTPRFDVLGGESVFRPDVESLWPQVARFFDRSEEPVVRLVSLYIPVRSGSRSSQLAMVVVNAEGRATAIVCPVWGGGGDPVIVQSLISSCLSLMSRRSS